MVTKRNTQKKHSAQKTLQKVTFVTRNLLKQKRASLVAPLCRAMNGKKEELNLLLVLCFLSV